MTGSAPALPVHGHVAPLLRVRDVAVRYIVRGRIFTRGRSDRWALGGVSFDVQVGETLGVVGRNGAGKTTLLRLLAGILGPDRGTIERAPGFRASLLSLQVGFLPQLTGRENATLSGMLLGLRRAEVAARLDSIIAFAELAAVIEDPIATWSDGMRARLGFSVAWHADPDLLLLDEALGTGDAAFHEKSAAAMRERIRSHRTCVLVSHDAATIRELCDRCIWIEHGVVAAAGLPDDVLAAYGAALHGRVDEVRPTLS
jgi:lipopolysaccharide transport system ATP-binding protein